MANLFNAKEVLTACFAARRPQPRVWIADITGAFELPPMLMIIPERMTPPEGESGGVGGRAN